MNQKFWTNLIKLYFITIIIFILNIKYIDNGIIPPPWSNPNLNPCANKPNGWQLLYYKPLNECFKIFTIGHPCPPTKELVPVEITLKLMESNGIHAECKCPPGTAEMFDKCVKIFKQGVCKDGEYVNPVEDKETKTIRGTCKKAALCPKGMGFKADENKCVQLYTRGSCPIGKILYPSRKNFAVCHCNEYYMNIDDKLCYEPYTRGRCSIKGLLHLPGGTCGCKPFLPHYHFKTGHCYEFGTRGPCPPGHIYTISKDDNLKFKNGKCVCKEGYVRSLEDGSCYRIYTKGPCADNEFIEENSICINNICSKSQLYFPKLHKCYTIGTQGPCPFDQVVIFDVSVRSSIDGISYNGICGCIGIIKNLDQKCYNKLDDSDINKDICNVHGMGKINETCYKLYTRGPCEYYEWVEPNINNNAECKCQFELDRTKRDQCNHKNNIPHNKLKIIKIFGYQPDDLDYVDYTDNNKNTDLINVY